MIQVYIALPSGKRKSLSVPQSSKVGDLKRLAQRSFEQPFLRLVTAEGHALVDPAHSLQDVGLQEGDNLTAIAHQIEIASTDRAFAVWYRGCSRIVTWGDPYAGGNSSEIQDQLTDVQQLRGTERAFVAILGDGSIVAWGDPRYGGDISAAKGQLKSVQHIQSTVHACAGIRGDAQLLHGVMHHLVVTALQSKMS